MLIMFLKKNMKQHIDSHGYFYYLLEFIRLEGIPSSF